MTDLVLDTPPESELIQRDGWLPKDQRKKILLLSDDFRMPSGVGVMSREIVLGTCHRYNWVQLGAAINHPEVGKAIDVSESIEKELHIKDPYARVYPYNGYGDPNMIRFLLKTEKPDAILHFTDPRFWTWLYQMEHEIRQQIPLLYYHVWDDDPFPKYNELFYRSCDAIYSISKQTYNIVKNVWTADSPDEWQTKYIPHGVNHKVWKRASTPEELKDVAEFRTRLFGNDADKVKFVVLYNNRNIRRKMTGDVILAYREFLLNLPKEKQDECRLLMHTAPSDDNGTDLIAIFRDLAPEVKFVFSPERISPLDMIKLYNNIDVTINLASNEGFGIGTLESIMTEKMIVANVTGGLQDQMGFKDSNGNELDADVHYNAHWRTNADGKYRTHGEWCVPVFPSNRSLNGAPQTPYIFDDRCNASDAAAALRQVYDLGPEERARRGKIGRDWACSPSIGMSSEEMCNRFMSSFEDAFENWVPRAKYGIYKSE